MAFYFDSIFNSKLLPFEGSQQRLYELIFSGSLSQSNSSIGGQNSIASLHLDLAFSHTLLQGSMGNFEEPITLQAGMNILQANSWYKDTTQYRN